MYQERRISQSELLQLLLLDNLYSQSGSERIVFQGGTALRWVYGGMRFSEDLDFVSDLTREEIETVLAKAYAQNVKSCIAQFGRCSVEQQVKDSRRSAYKTLFICRPEAQRERIAVRLEFEMLQMDQEPKYERFVLRDLPQVAGLIGGGRLVLPYTSSIVLAETPEELLSDKIRALLERKYLKGRDIFDIWWIVDRMGVQVRWPVVRAKLAMYQTRFTLARKGDYFQTEEAATAMIRALDSDLGRFIPQNIISVYQKDNFRPFIHAVKEVTRELWDQGMREYFETDDR
ncbi:MAG: nucleotidyl transferase AbiEii/AbiGii toxin family protein [Deltaproteobacteria bacterium]|nr:nucleotidyl transferase AbiEii/AbiGii toxin family protein [Deltaproteobacteria bacterium]